MATDTRARRRRLLAILGTSAVVGVIAAVINSGIVGLFPLKLRLNNLQIAAATTYVDVDPPAGTPSLAHGRADPPLDVQTFVKRAELLGRMIVSRPVLEQTAQRCGIPPAKLSGLGRTTADVPDALTQPNSEQRASDIQASTVPYQIQVEGRPTIPIIDVYSEAPTIAAAECLGNAAPVALTNYLGRIARAEGSTTPLVHVQTLGPARGDVANSGATVIIAFLTFLTFFALSVVALLGIGRLRRRRAAGRPARAPDAPGTLAAPLNTESDGTADSWPHTTRALPWMFAAFIALIWLTPFNNIALTASLPIELRLDRIVLPFVVIVWLLALAARGRYAPRLRMTWIHAALGALLLCAFLSVVTDARYLNQTFELALSLKKLPLMLAYISVFVIASSAIRRSEVRPLLSYTLGLAIVVAIGMIIEYRTKQNLFWHWSQKLLPSIFTVNGALNGNVLDATGRGLVRGPAEVPLEAVAMLTFAVPIALVRLLQAPRWRARIMYSVAVCLLVAAMFATYRKSAIVAPIAAVLTLAYFRRRELLKLAPLGLILLVLVSAISPGALGSTVRQFTRSDATAVPTVSDRTSDYDAVRPDVWTHLLLGRGWGSYNHDTYRILDSELLTRTIETGVIGLFAFLLVPVAVVGASRKTIALRDRESAPVALVGAATAMSFLVLAALFDELSFPHAAYIFLYIVGLETVMLRRGPPPVEAVVRPVIDRAALDEAFEPATEHDAQASLVPVR